VWEEVSVIAGSLMHITGRGPAAAALFAAL